MKYVLLLIGCMYFTIAECSDTVYVENNKDINYQRYLDSLKAYEVGYSVAKNVADSVKRMLGNSTLDGYFLSGFMPDFDSASVGYYYNFYKGVKIDIGHVNDQYYHMAADSTFPWPYLEIQYRRLDSLTVQPWGIMQGGQLPNVYIYLKPKCPVVVRKKIKRFTVVGQTIKFGMTKDGKTKVPYIEKLYYIEDEGKHPIIDSIEKLDPVYHKHLDF